MDVSMDMFVISGNLLRLSSSNEITRLPIKFKIQNSALEISGSLMMFALIWKLEF